MQLSMWNDELNSEQSLEILCDLALSHCHEAGGTEADALAVLIAARRFKEVCEYEVKYDSGLTVHQVIHLRQALAFFTKVDCLDIGVDKEAVARTNFYKSELECLKTNRLFDMTASGDYMFPLDVQRVLSLAEYKIAEVLGPVPKFETLDLKFGPGATVSVPKRNACAREKLCAVPSCSTNLLPLVPFLYKELPHYMGLHADLLRIELCEDGSEDEVVLITVQETDGKISFVPKNAKTYRTVMTEPTLNSMVQGGFGQYISERLIRIGQSPRDQSRNQILAREGSLTGALATLDLSMASDSISTEFVASLLPYEWFAALSLCRTPTVRDDVRTLRLHKFSSMGNGFTFPLQTLIFWALASASAQVSKSTERRVSVYGDDIIVGVDVVPLLSNVLRCTGFTLNKEKSYWSGPFRESCGKDYYFGFDVRPFFARSMVTGEFLFLLHNFYYRNYDHVRAARVLGLIPQHLRIFGPDGYGDGHLLSDTWNRIRHKRDLGYAGYVFDTYVSKPRLHRKMSPGDWILPSYSSYVRENALQYCGSQKTETEYEMTCSQGSLTPHVEDRKGNIVPALAIPGTSGYKRISIYTLTP